MNIFIRMLSTALLVLLYLGDGAAAAQQKPDDRTFGERLGWKHGDRVVIIHVDDAGMSHDSDVGVEKSLDAGLATSFSVMMPCPWVPEIVHYIKSRPEVDGGLQRILYRL